MSRCILRRSAAVDALSSAAMRWERPSHSHLCIIRVFSSVHTQIRLSYPGKTTLTLPICVLFIWTWNLIHKISGKHVYEICWFRKYYTNKRFQKGKSGFGESDLCIDCRIRKDITQNCIFMMKSTPGHMWLDLCGQPCEAVRIQAVNNNHYWNRIFLTPWYITRCVLQYLGVKICLGSSGDRAPLS